MNLTRQQVIDNWPTLCTQVPLICGINTFNNELTIYACLQQAVKNFHKVIIFDDGSTDNTLRYINKFIEDHRPNNLMILSVDHIDPWPDQVIEKDHGPGVGTVMKKNKTHAKSKAKSFEIVKRNFPTAIYVSLESDVICNDGITQRIYERISKWDDPFTDCEFFNVLMTIDTEWLRAVTVSEEEPVTPPGTQQRKIYDHPGDWTLSCQATFGDLTIGPDPSFPYGACILPWLEKNQCGKKGQDTDPPFGFHMYSYNNNSLDADLTNSLIYKITETHDPYIQHHVLKNVWFPKVFKLDESRKRYIESEECVL